VNIVTPVHVAGIGPAVLVNRGWVYSPNMTDVDLSQWREPDSVDADGWVEIPTRPRGPARLPSAPRAFRWLDTAVVARQIGGGPITPYYVVLEPQPGDPPRDRPVRLERPALDEGPHKGYAIQWFCFALVAIVGAVVFARSSRRTG
jgi:surfeit locus 1 family protein